MTNEQLYVAQIVEDATGEVVRQSTPSPRRHAEKIADGMSINLNWDRFSAQVVEAPPGLFDQPHTRDKLSDET